MRLLNRTEIEAQINRIPQAADANIQTIKDRIKEQGKEGYKAFYSSDDRQHFLNRLPLIFAKVNLYSNIEGQIDLSLLCASLRHEHKRISSELFSPYKNLESPALKRLALEAHNEFRSFVQSIKCTETDLLSNSGKFSEPYFRKRSDESGYSSYSWDIGCDAEQYEEYAQAMQWMNMAVAGHWQYLLDYEESMRKQLQAIHRITNTVRPAPPKSPAPSLQG